MGTIGKSKRFAETSEKFTTPGVGSYNIAGFKSVAKASESSFEMVGTLKSARNNNKAIKVQDGADGAKTERGPETSHTTPNTIIETGMIRDKMVNAIHGMMTLSNSPRRRLGGPP